MRIMHFLGGPLDGDPVPGAAIAQGEFEVIGRKEDGTPFGTPPHRYRVDVAPWSKATSGPDAEYVMAHRGQD